MYVIDEIVEPSITVKVVGHRWYWGYEYSDYSNHVEFDSYVVPIDDLENGQLRLLEVDSRLALPIDTHIRVLITGADVLHSFATPAIGVKADAVPG